mmetsp:Transcript_14786/g.46545  ORF Transcript_14786/g.46545 Transcript_14786/m.46545 type:complete len:434 (+) Transcript_14786:52-1353(+)
MVYRDGEAVGPYRVLRFLGRGSFGVVLLAEDPQQLHQQYALKIVPCDHLDGDTSERARNVALAEAELLKRLRHPHIVSCHEMRWDPMRSVVWLSLDYMDGGDLNSYIEVQRRHGDTPPLPAFQRRVLAAVGSALRYIHALGVLHRDVKPCNVLLTQGFKDIKLADFGISKILEVTAHAHTVVGTPHYLSPEIVCGEPYGPPSDAWALGVGIYELASLRRPFQASNQLALVRQIVETRPVELPPDTAPDIVSAVFGLLDKDPWQRMAIADSLAVSEAVKALVPLPPAPLFPPPPPPTSSRAADSCTATGGSTKDLLPVLEPEEPELVKEASDWSLVTEVELDDEPPRMLPAEEPPLTPSPRRETAFGLADEELRTSEKKSARGRSWFRFAGLGLRSARHREESETVISAFSEEGDGGSATPQANTSSRGFSKGR